MYIQFMNKIYSVLVNAVIEKDGKILLSQRSLEEAHEPGKWTIPGGKVENHDHEDEIFNIIQETLVKESMEEVGVEVHDDVRLIENNIFRRNNGQMVLALVFLCKWKSGEPAPLEDTINVSWASEHELDNYQFPPNVKEYIIKGFRYIES